MMNANLVIGNEGLNWLETLLNLRRVCTERGIVLRYVDQPLQRCVAFFAELSLVFVANNCKEKQLNLMADFILSMDE